MLAVERARREAAEQLAVERAARVDDLRAALRLPEAGSVGRAQQEAVQEAARQPQERPQEPPAPPGPRTPRRWWLSRWWRP